MFIERYISYCLWTVVSVLVELGQILGYEHCILGGGKKCPILLFMLGDEYLITGLSFYLH